MCTLNASFKALFEIKGNKNQALSVSDDTRVSFKLSEKPRFEVYQNFKFSGNLIKLLSFVLTFRYQVSISFSSHDSKLYQALVRKV